MDTVETITLSVALPAVVGAVTAYWSQRFLVDRRAHVDYEYHAKKRLYETIGPLRFQMVLATRDVVRRMSKHHETPAWNLSPKDYFGKSTMYRLLRPLAIAQLIDRQMSSVDLSVDATGLDLLRFQTAAYRVLTGADPLPGYDGLDWGRQTQHVFRDNLRRAASCLIGTDSAGSEIIIDFGEFSEKYHDPHDSDALRPLAQLFDGCARSLADNPVFWTRLVGYTYVCNWYLGHSSKAIGMTERDVDVVAMLRLADDDQIRSRLTQFPAVFQAVVDEGL